MAGNAPGGATSGENRGGSGAAPGQGSGGAQAGGGRGGFGGGRGFDPNMTPEERRKRMEERMAQMTPEERAAFQERMAARARGGFGGGQGEGGGRGGFGGGQPGERGGAASQSGQSAQNTRANANANPQGARDARQGRIASAPTMATGATTIDSLFGPLPTVETRGQAWLFENKQLKQVRLRLGVTDGTYTEVLQSDPEVKEGTEVVTNVIIEQTTTTGTGNANNPLMGPQRGRPGGPGGGGGGRGGR
jgi:hypothetical protein